jgi:hypothetical protein
MDCERARKLMPLALEAGDATEATRAGVLAHAEACTACRAELEAYRRASDALATVREAPEPPGGWAGIWAGVAERLVPDAPARVAIPAAPAAVATWGRRLTRAAAVLLASFTAGFTAYHVAIRPAPPAGGGEKTGTAAPVELTSRHPGPSGDGATALPAAFRERVGLVELNPQPGAGWRVRQVLPGSPASACGIRPDDVLQAANGAALPPSAEELNAMTQRLLQQSEIRLRVLRGGSEQEVVLRIQVLPDRGAEAPKDSPPPAPDAPKPE